MACANAAAVELAARSAHMTGGAIGEHCGIGAIGVTPTHRRLADRPKVVHGDAGAETVEVNIQVQSAGLIPTPRPGPCTVSSNKHPTEVGDE